MSKSDAMETAEHEQMVARRLRVVRQAQGLSQRELARRTGVGSGTISQIEANATQPSVAVLKKILDGIPMDLATFFSFDMPRSEGAVFRKGQHIDIGAKGIEYLLIGGARPDRKIQFIDETYEPGRASGRHALTHEGEECGLVITGVLELTLGNEVYSLREGDAYYFHSSEPHKFRNAGEGPLRVISACTPPTF